MIQALLLAIWAGLCTWDQFGPHLGFRKPLLASVGVGIILGDMPTAIMIGKAIGNYISTFDEMLKAYLAALGHSSVSVSVIEPSVEDCFMLLSKTKDDE